jgi:uncharacterized membrane protein YesL
MRLSPSRAAAAAREPHRHDSGKVDLFLAVSGGVYAALVSNLLLVLGCAPLVVGLVATDPARSWPWLAAVTPLCAPALVGVFAVMAAHSPSGSDPGVGLGGVVATFTRGWWASLRGAVAVGALAMAALVVLGVDLAWAWGRPIGAVAIPVLVTLMVLVVATALLTLVVLAERPRVALRDALRASLYLCVRRWYFTGVSLVVLVLLVQVVAARPAIGLGLVASPLLYVVWAGSRYSLRPALDPVIV